jgi:hypothetical protein
MTHVEVVVMAFKGHQAKGYGLWGGHSSRGHQVVKLGSMGFGNFPSKISSSVLVSPKDRNVHKIAKQMQISRSHNDKIVTKEPSISIVQLQVIT